MKKRAVYVLFLFSMGLALVACEQQKIGDIIADPGSFHDKEVTVGGTVITSIGVLGKGIDQIDDGTGKLWVWSEAHGVPSKGALVGVKGHILPTITFLGQNYATVMRESDRRAKSGD